MDNSFKKMIGSAPRTPGVYLFFNQKKEVIYVGKAINLHSRLKSYQDPKLKGKTALMIKEAKGLKHIRVFSEIEALILEASLIKKYQPLYNLRLKDDKSFLYIAITKEEFPKVLAVRKRDLLNPKYLFGPFPSGKTVRSVLSYLRKIYPFCQQKTNRRPCFWSHLKLCHPCPGEIMQQGNKTIKQQLKKNYLNNIKNLTRVLNGKSKNLILGLTKQMDQAVKSEDFEKAAFYRNQIQRLNYITKPNHSLFSFLESPNFYEEEQEKEIEDLKKIVFRHSGKRVKRAHPESGSWTSQDDGELHRLECYDISNLSGQFATGSMAVFINGIADKTQYRRFKINLPCHSRESGNPDPRLREDDTTMLKEMLIRRMKHQEWAYPDLIIVDGGKPQVSAALSVIASPDVTSGRGNLLSIPIIGLAKRLETIVIPNFCHPEQSEGSRSLSALAFARDSSPTAQNDIFQFQEINLPIDSPALNLLKRLRDEAHRFALTYHRQLRKKSFLIS